MDTGKLEQTSRATGTDATPHCGSVGDGVARKSVHVLPSEVQYTVGVPDGLHLTCVLAADVRADARRFAGGRARLRR